MGFTVLYMTAFCDETATWNCSWYMWFCFKILSILWSLLKVHGQGQIAYVAVHVHATQTQHATGMVGNKLTN